MPQYRNERYGFELTYPEGWRLRRPSILGRLLNFVSPGSESVFILTGPEGRYLSLMAGPQVSEHNLIVFSLQFNDYLVRHYGTPTDQFYAFEMGGVMQFAALYSIPPGLHAIKYSVLTPQHDELAFTAHLGPRDQEGRETKIAQEEYDAIVTTLRWLP